MARKLLVLALVPYALWLVLAYRYHFLDGVNLLFHEAGHVFFGLLGNTTLQFLGGTIGQFVFPLAAAFHFLQRRERFETCVCLLWLAESGMYAAEYIADARDQALPLVGGHVHDWHWLLSRWGLLAHCETIGGVVHGLASLLALGAVGVALWLAFGGEPEPVEPTRLPTL